MPKIDQSKRYELQAKMMATDPFKAHEQSFEFVLPGEEPLYSSETLLKNNIAVDPLATSLGGFSVPWILFDVWNHSAIEN